MEARRRVGIDCVFMVWAAIDFLGGGFALNEVRPAHAVWTGSWGRTTTLLVTASVLLKHAECDENNSPGGGGDEKWAVTSTWAAGNFPAPGGGLAKRTVLLLSVFPFFW